MTDTTNQLAGEGADIDKDQADFDPQLKHDVQDRVRSWMMKMNKSDLSKQDFSTAFDIDLGERLVQNLDATETTPSAIDGVMKGTPSINNDAKKFKFIKLTIDDSTDSPLLERIAKHKKSLPIENNVVAEMVGASFPPLQIKDGLYTRFLYNLPGEIEGPNATVFVTSTRPDIENAPIDGKAAKLTIYMEKEKYEQLKKEALITRVKSSK